MFYLENYLENISPQFYLPQNSIRPLHKFFYVQNHTWKSILQHQVKCRVKHDGSDVQLMETYKKHYANHAIIYNLNVNQCSTVVVK